MATFAYPARVDFDAKLRGQRHAAFLQVVSTLASGFFLLFSSRCAGTWSTSISRLGATGRPALGTKCRDGKPAGATAACNRQARTCRYHQLGLQCAIGAGLAGQLLQRVGAGVHPVDIHLKTESDRQACTGEPNAVLARPPALRSHDRSTCS